MRKSFPYDCSFDLWRGTRQLLLDCCCCTCCCCCCCCCYFNRLKLVAFPDLADQTFFQDFDIICNCCRNKKKALDDFDDDDPSGQKRGSRRHYFLEGGLNIYEKVISRRKRDPKSIFFTLCTHPGSNSSLWQ